MADKQSNITIQVVILTHNHQNFIAKTIKSVLEQKTSFGFKIIILDDNSTDGTTDILKQLQSENPTKIELFVNQTNLGPQKSAEILAEKVSAKYLAWLDGDDCWCYENKLQEQIDFLEANPEYAGCFHDAKIAHQNQSDDIHYLYRTQNQWKTYSQFNNYSADFMPWALIARNIIPTASLVFKYANLADFIRYYNFSELSLSWALHLDIIKNSKFKYFNEVWSVYNDHSGGISKKYDIVDFKRNNIKILENLLANKDWDYYKAEIYKTICSEYRFILKSKPELSKSLRDYKKSLKQYEKYLKLANTFDLKQLKDDYYYVRDNGMVE